MEEKRTVFRKISDWWNRLISPFDESEWHEYNDLSKGMMMRRRRPDGSWETTRD